MGCLNGALMDAEMLHIAQAKDMVSKLTWTCLGRLGSARRVLASSHRLRGVLDLVQALGKRKGDTSSTIFKWPRHGEARAYPPLFLFPHEQAIMAL